MGVGDQPHMAYCESNECDWSELADTDSDAAVMMVCHFVVKHPQRYHLLTGKDPEHVQHLYSEHIERFKEKI